MSNSNATGNPNFGYCYSDGIDILLASHRLGIIGNDALRGNMPDIAAVATNHAQYFQVGEAYARYGTYLAWTAERPGGGARRQGRAGTTCASFASR